MHLQDGMSGRIAMIALNIRTGIHASLMEYNTEYTHTCGFTHIQWIRYESVFHG